MIHQRIITAALGNGFSSAIGIGLENNACIVLIFADYAKIKCNVFFISVECQQFVDPAQTLQGCLRLL